MPVRALPITSPNRILPCDPSDWKELPCPLSSRNGVALWYSACGPTDTIPRTLVRAETYKFTLEGGEIYQEKSAGIYQV